MAEKKQIEGKIFRTDSDLIEAIQEVMGSIPFLLKESKDILGSIDKNVNLNYQSEKLLNLWKYMIGNAIVYLKKNDSREAHKDQMMLGVGRLHTYISEYNKFEKIFYGTINNYRDHVIHAFRTYLLGDYLIRNSYGYSNIDPKTNGIDISKHEKEAMWCIISLSHDISYPLEKIHKLNEPIRNILKTYGPLVINDLSFNYFPQFSEISKYAIQFLSSRIETVGGKKVLHVQPKYYQKFLSGLADYNHGVLSSILLMKDLVYFKESDYSIDTHNEFIPEDLRQFTIRRDILRSIASHNCPDIYYLTGTNFSFILKAIDEMQEWGRPRLSDITKRGGTNTRLQINKFNETEVDYKITFEYPDEYYKIASNEEKEYSKTEVSEYFKIKCGEWMNVLRSAVKGANRNLILNFTVEYNIDENKQFKLTHSNPLEIEITPLPVKESILKDKLF